LLNIAQTPFVKSFELSLGKCHWRR
jgi:hypothetical protein